MGCESGSVEFEGCKEVSGVGSSLRVSGWGGMELASDGEFDGDGEGL